MKSQKIFTILTLSALILTACGEKDAQYFYDKPEEAKRVSTECNAKLNASEITVETLTQLRDDVQCQNATLAIMGIQMGDLKKAQLANEEKGWKSLVSTLIEMNEGFLSMREELKKIVEKPFAEAITEFNKNNNAQMCSASYIKTIPIPAMKKLVEQGCSEIADTHYQLLFKRFGNLSEMSIQEKNALANDLTLTEKSCSFSILDTPEQRFIDLCKSIQTAKEEIVKIQKIQVKRDELSKLDTDISFRGKLNILKNAYPISCSDNLEAELCQEIDAKYEDIVKREFTGIETKSYEERLEKQNDIKETLSEYCFKSNLSNEARTICVNLKKVNEDTSNEFIKRGSEETLRIFRN